MPTTTSSTTPAPCTGNCVFVWVADTGEPGGSGGYWTQTQFCEQVGDNPCQCDPPDEFTVGEEDGDEYVSPCYAGATSSSTTSSTTTTDSSTTTGSPTTTTTEDVSVTTTSTTPPPVTTTTPGDPSTVPPTTTTPEPTTTTAEPTTASPTTTTTCTPTQIIPCNHGDFKSQLITMKPKDTSLFRGQAYYAVTFAIQATCNLPRELFVVRKREARFSGTAFTEEFQSVAMPVDLARIPTAGYDFDNRRRVHTVNIWFSHLSLAAEFEAELIRRLQKLSDAMKHLADTADVESKIIF